MEKRGLVRREHDPSDKRRRFVYLTNEGQALLAKFHAARQSGR